LKARGPLLERKESNIMRDFNIPDNLNDTN
jgi:hypothetical protein